MTTWMRPRRLERHVLWALGNSHGAQGPICHPHLEHIHISDDGSSLADPSRTTVTEHRESEGVRGWSHS
nr:hypothetical protein Itr_chr01CG16330 [Ipomoea trifida]